MSTVPQTIIGRIQFFEQHLPVWSISPTSLGLAPTDIVALNTLTSDARAKYDLALATRSAAKARTEEQNIAVDAMYDYGADLIKTIRAFAEKTGNPGVYALAEIPAPAAPSPAGPPEQPTNLGAAINPTTGALRLTWTGSVGQSAYFSIFRRAGEGSAFTMLDSTDAKFFEDASIPANTTSVEYYVQARRESFRVDSTSLVVRFGSGGMTFSAGGAIHLAA
jgi:hypothetical protein